MAVGTAKVTMSETATVTSGQTYTLTVSGTVNGNAFAPTSVMNLSVKQRKRIELSESIIYILNLCTFGLFYE